MPEISKVVVEKPAVVDVLNKEVTSTAAPAAEPSMAEYAKMREAEVRGETYEPKPSVITEAAPAAATEESAAATEQKATVPADEEDPLTQIEETHVAKKGISKRMGELTAEREAAKAEAATQKAEAEKAKLEAKAAQDELTALKQEAEARAKAIPEAKDDLMPDRDNFDDPDEYNLAIAQFATRQEMRKANEQVAVELKRREEATKVEAEKERIETANAQITELHRSFQEKVTTAKAAIPDFDEKVTNNKDFIVRNELFWAAENSDMGPQILYHLADHPEDLKELQSLLPATPGHVLPPKFLMRMGKLEAELSIANKPKPSKAAAPIKPVGNRQSPEKKSAEDESPSEYADRVNKEIAQTRAGRTARH